MGKAFAIFHCSLVIYHLKRFFFLNLVAVIPCFVYVNKENPQCLELNEELRVAIAEEKL
jgi:hypothetical protein